MRKIRDWLNRIKRLETATGASSDVCTCDGGTGYAVFVIDAGDPPPADEGPQICERCGRPVTVATFIVEVHDTNKKGD